MTPPQLGKTRQRFLSRQGNERYRRAFKASAGLKIGIAGLFPEPGFLFIGE